MHRLATVLLYSPLRFSHSFAGPVANSIYHKLTTDFEPTHLEVQCESSMHNVPRGAEKHFHVLIVSDKFKNVSPIQRHRLVHASLQQELSEGVHALRITAKTADQWHSSSTVPKSPPCLGKIKAELPSP